MSYTHIKKDELFSLLKTMASYIDKHDKKNEAMKREWIHDRAAAMLCCWSWLPWMSKRRAVIKATASFAHGLAGETRKKYFFRCENIEDSRLIMRRITQLAERDYNDVMISDRHLDFLLNCNWRKV